MSVKELREFTLQYYLTHLKDKKVAIKDFIKEITFTTKAGRKIAHGEAMYSAKAVAIKHLEELIKNSTYNNWGDRKPQDNENILGYLNFKSKLIIDGEKRHIWISFIFNKDRELKLKSYDIGKKKSGKVSQGVLPSAEETLPLSDRKITKKSENTKQNPKKSGLSAPQLSLSTDDFKKMSVQELREFTLDFYNNYLKGKTAIIKKHLKEVVFTSKAGRKIAIGEAMYSAKAVAVTHLQELIENSTYNNWGDRKSSDSKDVLGYLNFKSKLTIDGEKRHLRIALVMYKDRSTELKNVEVGRIKKTSEIPQEPVATLQDGEFQMFSDRKITKKSENTKQKPKKSGLSAPQLSLSTDDFKKMSVPELREFTLQYYLTHLKDKKVAIKDFIKEITFTTKAGRKIAHGEAMYSAKAVAIKHLEELIKNSTYNNWGDRKPQDNENILGYLNFKSKLIIDGEKRHIRISVILDKNRNFELKSFDIGKKENSRASKGTLPSAEEAQLFDSKITKKSENTKQKPKKSGLSAPAVVVSEVEKSPAVRKNSIANLLKNNHLSYEKFTISDPELSRFLGDVEKKTHDSLVITLTGGQGSGKTRFAFQFMNALAQAYSVGHISAEEHPTSVLYAKKVGQYLNEKAVQNIEAHDVKTISEVEEIIRRNDVIVIDSFQKLQEIDRRFEVDKDLRKKYNGKLFLVIYQQTTAGNMRGGSKSQFDGDIILFTEKFTDYRENYIYPDKNRYNALPANELKYSIFEQRMLPTESETQVVENEEPTFDVVY